MSLFKKIVNRGDILKWKNGVNFLSVAVNIETHPNIVKSKSEDVEIPNITIPELIYSRIESFPHYIATESPETGRKYTFEQIKLKSKNLSKHLKQKFKLKDGDVVALLLPNLPEFVICFLGSLEARLIVTTMNHMYTADEISKQIIDADPKLVITQAGYLNTLRSAANLAKKQLPTVIIKERQDESIPQGTIDFFELINTVVDIPDIQPGKPTNVAMLPYSSGTSGLPKGVELTHTNIVANICQLDCDDFSNKIYPSESFQDISPGVLPFYHIYGLTTNFLHLCQGIRNLALSRFTPESYIAALKNYPITLIFAAPPLVLFLTAHPEVKSEYFKHLRIISSGAAPLGYLDEERFIKKVGRDEVRVVQGYGLTECSPVVSFSPKNTVRTNKNGGSVGTLIPNTFMKIINPEDPAATPLGPNEKGEVLIKGPQVMKGYYNKPEATKNAFLDGWLRTGDIGHYNEEKHIFISDRLKELIKVKGYQVAPAELEAILRNHPAVQDAAVIGIPHDLHGEVPRAFVVPKAGSTPFSVDDLNNYFTKKVASYKNLAGGIEVVEAIPKNNAGKILRRKIKEEFLKKNA